MRLRNRDIVAILNETADLLDIREENAFRVRSYRNAARTIGDLDQEVADLVSRDEDLAALPDIGGSMAGKLEEIVTTGRLAQLDHLREEMDPHVVELLQIPNLGPSGARKLYKELGIAGVEGVIKAAEAGRIADVKGFGKKTESRLAADARTLLESGSRGRLPISEAEAVVEPLVGYLEDQEHGRIAVAGSYRRRAETIGDIDIVVTCDDPSRIMDAFVSYERVDRVVARGDTRSTIVLDTGLHVDLRAVPEESFGSALYYFTGSKNHNVAVRRLAQDRGLKINEYGVFDGENRIAGDTEESVFSTIDLPYICPEIRENRGEVEAAREGALPQLIELDDIRGDLHMHTKATDGKNTIRELADAAKGYGYEYIAITDHSARVRMAHGLDADRLARQIDEVRQINRDFEGIEILAGIEVDILKDGTLDLPDEVLERLDVVIAAVHYDRNLGAAAMTDRVVRAITNHPVSILAHPTGRMIGQREPYEIDLDPIFEAAAEAGICLEINANPDRLDLSDRDARAAIARGATLAISTDAHSMFGLSLMRYGVDTARRGWVEPGHVLNTMPLGTLRRTIRNGEKRGR